MPDEERLGEVIHYYDRVQVAVLRLTRGLRQGERVRFHGAHTDFEQVVGSMQVEHAAVTEAAAGTEVAVKVEQRCRPGDTVARAAEKAST
jgi:putative protease